MLRVCLDLNVFVADLLAEAAGRPATAARSLVAAVAAGRCALGPIQLVISFGMLDRLESVMIGALALDPALARERRELIAAFAALGPAAGPSLTLGGTGTMPMLDEEDGHVLDTALAGRADWLATANQRDFIAPARSRLRARQVNPELGVIGRHGDRLLIVHPRLAAGWMRDGDGYRAQLVSL